MNRSVFPNGPEFCTKCPFVNTMDNCMLQDDDAYLDTDTWDEMYAGCPLQEVEDYGKELRKMKKIELLVDDNASFIIVTQAGRVENEVKVNSSTFDFDDDEIYKMNELGSDDNA